MEQLGEVFALGVRSCCLYFVGPFPLTVPAFEGFYEGSITTSITPAGNNR